METLKQRLPLRAKLGRLWWPFGFLSAAAALACTEWIHRGGLDAAFFGQYFFPHFGSYLCSWLLLACLYFFTACLTTLAPLGVLACGAAGCVPAVVTFFKLQLRGEPFFPWDLSQGAEAAQVVGQAGLELQTSMWASALIFLGLALFACLLPRPRRRSRRGYIAAWAAPGAAGLALLFLVFLNPAGSRAIGIVPDMWMQNRYYRYYGVIAGFLTNIQNLEVSEPDGYSREAVDKLVKAAYSQDLAPKFAGLSPAGEGQEQPTIIFVMNESFWDVEELTDYGVEFDGPVTPNLQRLKEQAAYGKAYSPSFGGGTCDVEFEALTGFSIEFLPGGCKPFQQHVTRPMFSIASYLKEQGYSTLAVHCYYAKYWSRNTAYPNLGFDEFVSLEDFIDPEKKRAAEWSGGLVSDAEMARRIIYEYENRDTSRPLFLHAVTMQNHTSYRPDNYPEEELVDILSAPAGISEKTLGALRDFATGVRDADAMLGTLTDYFSGVDEPVILVFWGDHYNPIGSGYEVYTATGYTSGADSESPELHQMPLLIWSNYRTGKVDLGTVAAYQISPVLTELYGLDQPPMFRYLANQLSAYRGRTLGVTVQPDGACTEGELSEAQQAWFDGHWMLQYDLMFGEEYALSSPRA